MLALVNTGTIHIDGYFEETKLPRIRVGDQARVRIMWIEADLPGIVESLTPESKTASAVQALRISLTSIQPSAGCGWRSGTRCESNLSRQQATSD